MKARKWDQEMHSRMIRADEIRENALDQNLEDGVAVLFVYITENLSQKVDPERLERLMEQPYILVGILGEHVGEDAIALAAKMHMRVALEKTDYRVSVKALQEIDPSLVLMGIEPTKIRGRGGREIKEASELIEMRFISRVFPDVEHADFKEWVKDIFDHKTYSQMMAIKECYDSYRRYIRHTKDRSVLAMEESGQFCSLAMEIHRRHGSKKDDGWR